MRPSGSAANATPNGTKVMIAFDSCILIYVLESNPEFAGAARDVFLDIERQGGVCSSLVVTESLHGSISSLSQLVPLQSPTIRVAPVTTQVAELAGRLRIAHRLKTADAIHIATALEAGAKIFVTNDAGLTKKKLGIEVKLLGR